MENISTGRKACKIICFLNMQMSPDIVAAFKTKFLVKTT